MSIVNGMRARLRGAEGADEGFTLIELLVVLLIIGILLAIAIPTFLSITKGANGTAAQSNLQTALTGADTYYTQGQQTYNGVNGVGTAYASTLSQQALGMVFTGGSSKTEHTVSVSIVTGGTAIVLEDYAPGQNKCWGILDIKSPLTTAVAGQTATGTYYFDYTPTGSTYCPAGNAITVTAKANGFPKV